MHQFLCKLHHTVHSDKHLMEEILSLSALLPVLSSCVSGLPSVPCKSKYNDFKSQYTSLQITASHQSNYRQILDFDGLKLGLVCHSLPFFLFLTYQTGVLTRKTWSLSGHMTTLQPKVICRLDILLHLSDINQLDKIITCIYASNLVHTRIIFFVAFVCPRKLQTYRLLKQTP